MKKLLLLLTLINASCLAKKPFDIDLGLDNDTPSSTESSGAEAGGIGLNSSQESTGAAQLQRAATSDNLPPAERFSELRVQTTQAQEGTAQLQPAAIHDNFRQVDRHAAEPSLVGVGSDPDLELVHALNASVGLLHTPSKRALYCFAGTTGGITLGALAFVIVYRLLVGPGIG